MKRRLSRVLAPLVAAAMVVVAAALVDPPAGAAATDGPYYVAVGASESLGWQPTRASPHGAPTDQGYADDVTATEQGRWPGLQLVHFGCPGITAEGALDGEGRCHFAAGSEVQTAVDFLRAHSGDTVLATVDLGFNDVWPCLRHHQVDESCVTAALGRISQSLPTVLSGLRAAGGNSMLIVGLEHNDPYLAAYLHGPSGQAFARASFGVIARLNAELDTIFRAAGALVADVPAHYRSAGGGATAPLGSGVPGDVARICDLTWMCTHHNLHPNAAGYRVIAGAVEAAIASA